MGADLGARLDVAGGEWFDEIVEFGAGHELKSYGSGLTAHGFRSSTNYQLLTTNYPVLSSRRNCCFAR